MIGPCLPPLPPYPDDPSDAVDLDVIRRDLERARSRRGGGWRYISTSVYTPAVAALVAVFEAACAQIDSGLPLMIEDPDRDPLSVAVNAARGRLSEDEIRVLFACYDPANATAASAVPRRTGAPVPSLTDEDLAQVRTLVPAECVGLLRLVDAMTAELARVRPVYAAACAWADATTWTDEERRGDRVKAAVDIARTPR